ncbi:cupin domain-containing protein [Streptosporangium sp. KLBMP 9127]|nr:cupin domain-containing protein [Streptosporangium sp. KLBMP 9127]
MSKHLPSTISCADVSANRRRGGDIRVLLSPKTVSATSGFMGALTLAPGEFITEHYHPYSEEFLYVTRGHLTMVVEGVPIAVSADEAIMVPVGVRHRAENNGDQPVHAVFQLSPLAPSPELGHVDTEPVDDPRSQQLQVGDR